MTTINLDTLKLLTEAEKKYLDILEIIDSVYNILLLS